MRLNKKKTPRGPDEKEQIGVARAEGFEPPTVGFGDRCSTAELCAYQ